MSFVAECLIDIWSFGIWEWMMWLWRGSKVNLDKDPFPKLAVSYQDASPVAQWLRIHLQCRRLAGYMGSIPGLGRLPGGGGNGNPFQCSWLENPMDRGARWAAVHAVRHHVATKQAHTTVPCWRLQLQTAFWMEEHWITHFLGWPR